MKIIKLHAENIKKIKAVDITPENNTVIISGKNGAGKSSVMDCLALALCGESENTTKPIREGQANATVKIDLGDYIVTKNWKENDKSYLKVESKDGARYPSPQTFLNKIIGKLSFDPQEFCNLNEKEQLKTLLDLVGLETTLNAIDDKKKEIYEQRTYLNRDIKQIEAKVAELKTDNLDLNLPTEEIKSDVVFEKIKQAQKVVVENTSKRNQLDRMNALRKDNDNHRKHLEAEIKKLQTQLRIIDKAINEQSQAFVALEKNIHTLDDPNIDELNAELAILHETNKNIRMANQYREVVLHLKTKQDASGKLTEELSSLDKNKKDALKAAKFPVEGLSFDESGVTYNGIPFKQCSTSERLRVSVAMAMALNPKLKVIRIMDGSLLDKDNIEIIKSMAKDNDYQVWCEIVDDSGKVGIYIEEGEVKNVN